MGVSETLKSVLNAGFLLRLVRETQRPAGRSFDKSQVTAESESDVF